MFEACLIDRQHVAFLPPLFFPLLYTLLQMGVYCQINILLTNPHMIRAWRGMVSARSIWAGFKYTWPFWSGQL